MRYILTVTFGLFLLAGAAAPVHAATLTLSPSSGTHTVGDTFTVDILLNTEGSGVDGVDINTLRFDTSAVKVVDADTARSGVQIDAGTLFSSTPINSVDTSNGEITFSQTTGAGNTFSNTSGEVLATITFEAIRDAVANVTFSFTQNSTTDTNIAADGSDILTNVVNGTYTIDAQGSEEGGSSSGESTEGTTTGGETTGENTNETTTGDTTEDEGGSADTQNEGEEQDVENETQDTENETPKDLTAPFERNLYLGVSNSDVERLQRALNTESATRLASSGPGSPGMETQYYGPITASAVKRFQCRYDIVCSGTAASTGYGVTGPKTRAKLNELYAAAQEQETTQEPAGTVSQGPFTVALTEGSRHAQVILLQSYLAGDTSLYPEQLVTGYFGPLTKTATQRFQCRYNIVCSGTAASTGYGRVGPQTRAKLNEVYGGKPLPDIPAQTQETAEASAIQTSTERAQEREAEVESESEGSTQTTPQVSTGGGTLFDRTLNRGDKGEEVKTLQRMLAQDENIYPEGYVTGFFTPATEIAVRKFQETYDIASSGSPGYGTVGPTTQAKLIEVFGRQ